MEGGGRRGPDTGRGGMDDGSRAATKDGGRDVTDVRSPGTSDNAVTEVRPSPLPLLLTQIILQGKRIDYLPSVSVITPPRPQRRPSTCLCLPVANSPVRRLSVRSCLS